MVPALVLVVTLRSVAGVASFFPNSAVFTPILGISVRVWGIFALELEFLGCACGGLLAPSAYPTLRQSPSVAGLEVLRCGPPHWLSLRVCVGPF